MHIQNRKIEGVALIQRSPHHCKRLLATRCRCMPHTPGTGLVLKNLTIGFIVINNENTQITQVFSYGPAGYHVGALLQHRGKPERRPLTKITLDTNFTAHHFCQPLGNGKAKSGSAIMPRSRSIRLREGFKYSFASFSRHANTTIAHLETQFQILSVILEHTEANKHFPLLGKLQGITNQVSENLAQAVGITGNRLRRVGINIKQQFQFFSVCVLGQQFHHFFNGLAHIEIDRFKFQLTGLYFGKIENIVNDMQQSLARTVHGAAKFLLLLCQLGSQQQFGHTQNTIHRRPDLMTHICEKL